ncbi:unnamed protein product [Arabidopsis thaliana]|uniref:(thale cress) hypothetical protein n=1 Tax=Arabidopsis thaliana TaxID=3702 RepID=A0A7G2E4F0_ARATH|nr:unnamed protein product [Arabidopsis thaliana]
MADQSLETERMQEVLRVSQWLNPEEYVLIEIYHYHSPSWAISSSLSWDTISDLSPSSFSSLLDASSSIRGVANAAAESGKVKRDNGREDEAVRFGLDWFGIGSSLGEGLKQMSSYAVGADS